MIVGVPQAWLRGLSRLDMLAIEADLDPDELRGYLEREIERRRAALPPVVEAPTPDATSTPQRA